MKIQAKKGKDGTPVEFEYPIFDTVDENIKAYGADIVNSRFKAALVVDVQNIARNMIGKSKTAAEIVAYLKTWKPGVRAVGKTAFEKTMDLLGGLTEEQTAALLAAIKGRQAGGTQAATAKPAAPAAKGKAA